MRVKHNISALNTYNKLQNNNKTILKSMEKLSSGLRINRAADDASGLTISEKMRAQIRGLEKAESNIKDGISLVQVADSGLGNIQDPNLIRLRELAVQAANDTLSVEDRQIIQQEVDQIIDAIDEIANNTEFNTIPLLNRTAGTTGTGSVIIVPGSEVNLTPAVGYDTAPTWVGNKIAFAENSDVVLMDEDGSNKNKILTNAASPSISPDQSKVAFIRDYNVYISDIDGTNQVQLTNTSNATYDPVNQSAPEWLPSGDYLIFASDNGIEKVSTSDSTDRTVIISGSNIRTPSITPDGEKLVYESNGKIYISNIDGSNSQEIGAGYEPTVSPDGTKIAYSDFTDIFVMNIDGSNISNVTASMPTASLHGHNHDPSWSPSSNQIVFHSDTVLDGSGDIWSVKLSDVGSSDEQFLGHNIILQVGPNAGNNFKIQLTDARTTSLGINSLKVTPLENAVKAIQLIDSAMGIVSSERSKYGSYQNALEHIKSNVTNYKINVQAAESRIRDLDLAKEMTIMANKQVLLQSSQTMMAQSNQLPQSLLQFLK